MTEEEKKKSAYLSQKKWRAANKDKVKAVRDKRKAKTKVYGSEYYQKNKEKLDTRAKAKVDAERQELQIVTNKYK